ncbi:MAG TPA: NAD(P)-dependent oxidoreductase [bacterium]|nr:NAD(P)-dependent oxidoreductase [bacterium]
MQKNVLVIGGAGFIGNAVAKELLMRGYNVSIFDINDNFENDSRIKFIKGDILDFNAVSDAIKDKAIVYNFAGIVDLEIANQQPYNTLKTNVLGNLNILEACKNHKVERYIFASTIYVYSDKGAFYRCSKQMSELMIETYSKKFELKYTILRYGSVYGPNAQKNNWINDVLEQALKNKKIIRYGDGNELREYIHIYDAARASVDILDEKFDNENVILTGNTAIKIKDLLFMIKEMFNNEIEIEYLPGNYEEHYEITPYTFKPKLGKKYLINPHIDLGQGLLDLLYKMKKNKNLE